MQILFFNFYFVVSIDIEDPIPLRRLNVARLIMLYVRNFEITDPAEALQYFYFLRYEIFPNLFTVSIIISHFNHFFLLVRSNKRDPDGRNLFLTCVSDLVIECRDYDLLFGKMQRNSIRSRGLIDQFESIEIDVRKACELVGDELIKRGLFEDAIKLYDLAGVSFQSRFSYVQYEILMHLFPFLEFVRLFRSKSNAFVISQFCYRQLCISRVRRDHCVNVFI